MTDLFTAIYSQFSGNANLVAALTGGMWNTQAKEEVSTPYTVFMLVSDVPIHFASGTNPEEALIQFDIYDKPHSLDDSVINDCYAKLTACYDNQLVAGSTYKYVFYRIGTRFMREDEYFRYIVEYQVFIYP